MALRLWSLISSASVIVLKLPIVLYEGNEKDEDSKPIIVLEMFIFLVI
ncbi:hypothetical protein OKW21_004127 [Catalinimonas alkaloidigena]|nr:hypothetical protein [Catalinimonas alkaloidigena]